MELTDIANALVMISNFVILPALSYGSQLALGALAVTLVYAIFRFSNFAQGDVMAFTTAITILLVWFFQTNNLVISGVETAIIVFPLSIIISIFYILTMDFLVYKHYRKINAKPITMVIASIGIMFITGGIVRVLIGPEHLFFADGVRFVIRASEFKTMTGLEQGLTVKYSQLITIVSVLILVTSLFYFLKNTKTGKSMRAYSDNKTLSLLSGINANKIVIITWIIVAILTNVAGVLYGLEKGFMANSYHHILLPIFAATIVGGIGSPIGAVVGAFIVSFSEILLTYVYKKFFIYLLPAQWEPDSLVQLLGVEYKVAISFIILVLVLIIKPSGIFKSNIV